MSGRRKWSETRDSRLKSDTDRARYAAGREGFRARLNSQLHTLAELRRARKLTQEQLASAMQVSQAQVSRVENQTDLYLSTLRAYIEALGGELQIRVTFPAGEWTEVAIGDITGAELSSSTVFAPSVASTATIKAISSLGMSGIGIIQSSTAFSGQSLAETLVTSALPPTPKLPGTWFGTLSTRIENFYSEGSGVERFAGRWKSDFNPLADVIYLTGHGVADSGRHDEIQTKVSWVRSTELRIPEDTDNFVTSAELKEG